jgi:hypothetical protein
MYQGRIGVVGYTQARGTSVVYTLNLDGHRTQVNHGTLGSTWVVDTDTAPVAPEAEAVADTPAEPAAPAVKAGAPAAPVAPRGVLEKGTQVRMLTGHYLGCTGTVTGAHAIRGPKPDAIYTVEVTDAGGAKVRTSMKHSSLGRAWVKAD